MEIRRNPNVSRCQITALSGDHVSTSRRFRGDHRPGRRAAEDFSTTPTQERELVNEQEIVRIAVRASMAAMGAMLACILALFLMAALVSPDVNIPGISLKKNSVFDRPAGD